MGACDVLRNICDRNIEGVDMKAKIYQRASLVSNSGQH